MEIRDKIPVVDILGVHIAAIDMPFLIDYTKRNIKKLSGKYMCVTNVFATVTASENKEYLSIQNNAIMAIPDGGPIASMGRKRGFPQMKRTTGPDYMKEIFKISKENGYTHFFYGSTPETIQKLEEKLTKEFEGIKIVGMYSPPFRELSEREDQEVIKMINDASPDFVWIGLGAPKQEFWMAKHEDKIKGFMVGVGAGFDYFAGNIDRAPMWMQKNNLEWLYRLIQEPKRLFKKYLVTNSKFIWKAIIRGQ